MEYRGDFLLGLIFGILWQSSVLVFATVLVSRFPGMGGWSRGEVLLIASMRLLSHALAVVAFHNLVLLPRTVQEGRIEGFLLRPMSVYRQVLLSRFHPNGLGDLCVALTLCALALTSMNISWTPARAGYALAAVIGGTLLEGAVATALGSLALRSPLAGPWWEWADEIMSVFGNYPLHILPKTVHAALTFVLPLAFVAYIPAAVLTGHANQLLVPTWLALASPLCGAAAFLLSLRLWRKGLRAYTGISG
ncbi:ABC-2 family transporter protein [Streptomyces sp. NPDC052020]|uniref:ABC transporter permease n=1 Tax=Streptomyces sp. NPDC052020 TaxID=3155677 RepID=UPI00341A973C